MVLKTEISLFTFASKLNISGTCIAPINDKLEGVGRLDIGAAFEVSWDFLFKCPTTGLLLMVKEVTKLQKHFVRKSTKMQSKVLNKGRQLISNPLPMPSLHIYATKTTSQCKGTYTYKVRLGLQYSIHYEEFENPTFNCAWVTIFWVDMPLNRALELPTSAWLHDVPTHQCFD